MALTFQLMLLFIGLTVIAVMLLGWFLFLRHENDAPDGCCFTSNVTPYKPIDGDIWIEASDRSHYYANDVWHGPYLTACDAFEAYFASVVKTPDNEATT